MIMSEERRKGIYTSRNLNSIKWAIYREDVRRASGRFVYKILHIGEFTNIFFPQFQSSIVNRPTFLRVNYQIMIMTEGSNRTSLRVW